MEEDKKRDHHCQRNDDVEDKKPSSTDSDPNEEEAEYRYRDYAEMTSKDDDGEHVEEGRYRSETNFPVKLHDMLKDMEEKGLSSIVSWQPHGRSFVVHRQEEFVRFILPAWFRQTKLSSFQRQLNLYNFKRISAGPDKNGYYHEYFLRSKRALTYNIKRSKNKGKGARKPSNPEEEPDFYKMPPLPPEEPTKLQNVYKTNDPNISLFRSPSLFLHGSESNRLRDQLDAFTNLMRDQSLNNLSRQQQQPSLQPLSPFQPQSLYPLLSTVALQHSSPLEALLSNNYVSNLLQNLSLPQQSPPQQEAIAENPTLEALLSRAVVDSSIARRLQQGLAPIPPGSPSSLEQQLLLAAQHDAQSQNTTAIEALMLYQQLNELLHKTRHKDDV